MNRVYDLTIKAAIESTLDAETLRRYIVVALIDPSVELGETEPVYLDGETEMLEVIDYHDTELTETCPNCDGRPLEYMMFDIDGTNLEEHAICENCGYGRPALR